MQLYYPYAKKNVGGEMPTQGEYPKGYPQGAVIHYTAGGTDPIGTIKTLISKKAAAFVIAPNGDVYQNFPLNRWGHHAGVSLLERTWCRLVGGVSDDLVGIEVCCAGLLERKNGELVSWFGKSYPEAETRTSAGKDNQRAGVYHAYTLAQETSLTALLMWLKQNNPRVFALGLVWGHDEVCYPKGRKTDPGASLSMTMPAYRKLLLSTYERLIGKN